MVQTIGEAHDLGWKITVRCAHGRGDGIKKRKICTASQDLHLPTLIWTRGRAFPLHLLPSRMKCLRCGSPHVAVLFTQPSQPTENAARQSRPLDRLVRAGLARRGDG